MASHVLRLRQYAPPFGRTQTPGLPHVSPFPMGAFGWGEATPQCDALRAFAAT
jgi:hypothetical protein